ncbi:hypothetical protein FQN54_006671 [Arachnomyces sp. PD_36]|nr:hypothetical protein FQN54_006671 [Arachnomyces sp. PD_36]
MIRILALVFFTTAATVIGRPFKSDIQPRQYLEAWDDCESSSVDCAPEYEQFRRDAARRLQRPVAPVFIAEEEEKEEDLEGRVLWPGDGETDEQEFVEQHGFHPPLNDDPEFDMERSMAP